jgi:small subunit ribosomal protein S3
MRVTINRDWRSRWYGDKRSFGDMLHEDYEIRTHVKKSIPNASIAEIIIERYANKVRVTIATARPGIAIGRKGQDIERVREELTRMTNKEIYIEIREIRNADTNAQLVAEGIAFQLLRRVSFRRAIKRAIKTAMDMGVDGIKIQASGRLGGSELARREWYKEGKIPLHTFRANVEYGFSEARTTAGAIGIKVWICREKEEQEPAVAPR